MKRSHLVWLSGAVVVLGCTALVIDLLVGSGTPGSDSASRSAGQTGSGAAASDVSATELARMRSQVAVLRAELAGLKGQVSAGQSAVEAKPEPEPPMTEEERRAEDERRHAAYMDEVEAAFGREPVDPAWASSTSSRVWAVIKDADIMRTAARGVECRAQSCRIDVDDDGTGALHKQLPLFAQQFADSMPRMAGRQVRDERGGTRMVLYLMGGESAPASSPKN